MNQNDPIVIVSTKRTPIGQFQGALSPMTAPQLGSVAIASALSAISLPGDNVDEVIMGCVLPAGLGQAPARQATLGAKLPPSVMATTVNKVCGSGMKSMMIAHDALLADTSRIVVAGGMESMTNSPYLLPKARQGLRMGHATMYDHMLLDGLEDAYEKGKLMGVFAEKCAEKFGFTREMQDEFSLTSLKRAKEAIANGSFKSEICPVDIVTKTETLTVQDDELPGKAKPEKIPQLKPAFKENGTVTAANSSGISDGACVHVMMRASEAKKRNLPILATILAHASAAQEPAWFTTTPVLAIKKVLQLANWKTTDVDLYEINEAFAVVTLAAMKELSLPHDKVNIHGGACALGHPIGASGARIVSTLIYALKQKGLKRGVASLCIGGGEATAMAIEVNA
jgi:acetyl-CoA C-acetyltransferase